ncbi:pilus assembly protein [Janthinobacterium sp. SUN176]|uniref:TadE/TadG family type IV pilus assembly protein n=1 Tax=Janthinobacterium sp. SUN176 TaxID=3014788 RepID=UPI0027143830|nr:TadE family protein [Janthinobacterium sp. SUN176]MDO8072668.1 pilus assembly protein [Janthinobacterium sp. SUN176]
MKKPSRGAALVEFALIAPILFFLIAMIMELGVMFWVNLTMQYAVREGARYSITGQNNLDPASANKQRYEAVLQKIKDSSVGLYAMVSPVVVVNGVSQAPSAYNNNMFGAAGDIVVLQVNCTWPVITPAWRLMALLNPKTSTSVPGQYAFSVAATMRNEAF